MIVHTRTQEQWDFVQNKINYSFGMIFNKEGRCCIYTKELPNPVYSSLPYAESHYKKGLITFEQWLKQEGHEKEWYSEFLKEKKIWIGDNSELFRRINKKVHEWGFVWYNEECISPKGYPDIQFKSNNCMSASTYKEEFDREIRKEITLQDLGIEEFDSNSSREHMAYPVKEKGDYLNLPSPSTVEDMDKSKFKVGDEVYLKENEG